MRKGQATVEFLFAFTATMIMVLMLTVAVVEQKERLEEKREDMEKVWAVESAARAVEAALNAGVGLEFDFSMEGISYRAEEDRFLVSHKGRVVEIRGVFVHEESEPI
jgi:hypothetical protein